MWTTVGTCRYHAVGQIGDVAQEGDCRPLRAGLVGHGDGIRVEAPALDDGFAIHGRGRGDIEELG